MVPFQVWIGVAALFPLLFPCSLAVSEVSCADVVPMKWRRDVISIADFGAVGDGKTLNTWPFKKAIYRIQHMRKRGGTMLYIPPGVWLTGSFSLTSHMTLFLGRGAIIKATQDTTNWPLVDPLPSYGRGRELPGKRYMSFIQGDSITDVIITGENGTIDGQDSSSNVCIEDAHISTGDDLVAIKSGWDEYGIAYGRPSSGITIRRLTGSSPFSGIAIGSETSGGVDNILAENINLYDTGFGIHIKTNVGRGGYIRNVTVMNVNMNKVRQGIRIAGDVGDHPDEYFNRYAVPTVDGVTIKNVWGLDIQQAGSIQGIRSSPFTRICLSNVKLWGAGARYESWRCMDVTGAALGVQPGPCSELANTVSAGFCSGAF
ncbi:hypothetical protein ZIOFF_012551 [Zingiber officinale]|uniref:Polygalacturonase n=1 Tax=Zingiber officinale TaxID=94328 RepID=A0A8J5HPJ9_ZINOF|nr:hypothetical protein ZIOFF_012551 [Zingiber officinale]